MPFQHSYATLKFVYDIDSRIWSLHKYLFLFPFYLLTFYFCSFWSASFDVVLFSILVQFFSFPISFSCPLGLILIGAECVPVGDCFWSNECLNGGTCVRSPETLEAVCQCPPFYEGLLCEIATDKSFTIVGGRDFIIVIIFALMALLSKLSPLPLFYLFSFNFLLQVIRF